jgi:hypothetical protein
VSSRRKEGTLTIDEKRAIKALIAEGMRNQDIQDLVNRGRRSTINAGRITEIKQDLSQERASESELEIFKIKRKLFDPLTGLNDIDHERLIRAREAMMMAVHIFNSPHLKFRTELFAVLANIAWTYMLHEYYEKVLKESITRKDGTTVSLYELLSRTSCPVSKNTRKNLEAIKEIRDEVEHRIFGKSDDSWLAIFQACCVNFENKICDLFGKDLSLQSNLGFSSQFSRVSLTQICESQEFAVPANIQALDARLNSDIDESDAGSLEYKFRVVYTMDGSSKSGANIRFISPDSEEGAEVHNILVKTKLADAEYPFKPSAVVSAVKQSLKSFSSHLHQIAWKRHRVRPPNGAKRPQETDKKYSIYSFVYNGYSYSQAWIDFLIATYVDESELEKLRKYSPKNS